MSSPPRCPGAGDLPALLPPPSLAAGRTRCQLAIRKGSGQASGGFGLDEAESLMAWLMSLGNVKTQRSIFQGDSHRNHG